MHACVHVCITCGSCVCLFVFVYCIATTQLQIVQANIIHSQQLVVVVVADFQSSRFQLANIAGERGGRRSGVGSRCDYKERQTTCIHIHIFCCCFFALFTKRPSLLACHTVQTQTHTHTESRLKICIEASKKVYHRILKQRIE